MRQVERGESETEKPTIVGIGASAGGLAALKRFFGQVPEDSGLAFVVVVHLAAEHESLLAELLQTDARVPVQQVTEEVPLEPNRVYVIPPNSNLDAVDTHLRLGRLEDEPKRRAPIDHFFRTLARTHEEASIGIVLTGTGSDGAQGLKEIKEKDGLTIAQDPDEAEYDGMPRSAIATGFVDLVLPLDEIVPTLLRIAKTRPRLLTTQAELVLDGKSSSELQELFALLRLRTGRDFSRYKYSTILRRLTRRMQINHLEDLSGYIKMLREDAEEVGRLADDLLITVTRFFRDGDVFERLREDVVPKLFDHKGVDEEIRVWSVGCSTGEEAYSFAILLLEEASRRQVAPRVQIFATDLHEPSLVRARDGYFPGEIDVSEERRRRFFTEELSGYRICRDLREMVVFAPHNLLADPPFSRIDLITCRNLLIYLQRGVQPQVLELFHYALRPGGFLVLGTTETVGDRELFQALGQATGVYLRRDGASKAPRPPVFPLTQPKSQLPAEESLASVGSAAHGEVHLAALERCAPPSLLIGPDDHVMHLSRSVGRYLVHPGGEITSSVFKLVRDELQIELRALVHAVRHGGKAQRSRPIKVRFDGEVRRIVLDLRSVEEGERRGYVLLIFDERPAEEDGVLLTGDDPGAVTRVQELEDENALMRAHVQRIIEEHENSREEMRGANEELHSANEELRSTMEELETSKEELQSMNEELHTVNQENRHKVAELAQLSSDLANLLSSTNIATLFLDRDLRILRFTTRIGDLFNITLADRGRPLADFTNHLRDDTLVGDAASVLEHLVPVERELQDEDGRWYLTNLRPYRSERDSIGGVVITFVDITDRRRAEQAARTRESRLGEELDALATLQALVARLLACQNMRDALREVLDASMEISGSRMGCIHLWDSRDGRLKLSAHRGLRSSHVQSWSDLTLNATACWSRAGRSRRQVVVQDTEGDDGEEKRGGHREQGREAGFLSVQSTPLLSRTGALLGVLSTFYEERNAISPHELDMISLFSRHAASYVENVQDKEGLRQKTEALELEDQRRQRFLAVLGHELRNPLAALDTGLQVLAQGLGEPERVVPAMAKHLHQLKILVDDLLDVARLTRGKVSLRREVCDLVQVVQRSVEQIRGGLQEKRQHLRLDLPETLLLLADPVRLEQVISNLLLNASSYTPVAGNLEIRLESMTGRAVLEVADDGAGLDGEELLSVFEPFAQRDPARGGLGIGLSLARGLVELHGGTLLAASDGPGRGSTFTIELPLMGEGAESKTDGTGDLPDSLRILVVDDLKDSADMLALLLRAKGAQVRCAYTGDEALAKAERWRPQVALVDLALPDRSGFEVARELRSREGGTELLLISMSGFGDPGTEEQGQAAGFDDRFVKPVDVRGLVELFRRHASQLGA